MELDGKVCSFVKHCCPRGVHLFVVGKVVLLLFTTWSQISSVNSLLFSVPIGLVPTHTWIYTHVSHFAFNFTLNLYFRFRQGLLDALLASSLSSEVAAYEATVTPSSLCPLQRVCPLQRSTGNHISCWSPVPILPIFLWYSAEQWPSTFQISWASESQCFSLTESIVFSVHLPQTRVFSEGEGKEGREIESRQMSEKIF